MLSNYANKRICILGVAESSAADPGVDERGAEIVRLRQPPAGGGRQRLVGAQEPERRSLRQPGEVGEAVRPQHALLHAGTWPFLFVSPPHAFTRARPFQTMTKIAHELHNCEMHSALCDGIAEALCVIYANNNCILSTGTSLEIEWMLIAHRAI